MPSRAVAGGSAPSAHEAMRAGLQPPFSGGATGPAAFNANANAQRV